MALPTTPPLPVLRFIVYGKPEPQGSSRAFIPKGWKRPVITSTNTKLKPWRQQIAFTALQAAINVADGRPAPLFSSEPVQLCALFYFDRPKRQTKRERAQMYKVTKPDIDKLIRAIGDALTGIAYQDDNQIAGIITEKRFGSPARVEITVRILN